MFCLLRMLRLVVTLVAILAAVKAAIVRVDTVYGPVDGQTITLEDGTEVNSFYGIPFAKPPVGDLRWRVSDDLLVSLVESKLEQQKTCQY